MGRLISCVSSVTTPSFGSFTADEMKALAPHCVYADRHRRGYTMAELTAGAPTVAVTHVDIHTGAAQAGPRFRVEAGSPRIKLLG